ncbi:hypothetical protein AAGS40_24205 [Paraburkholderia sp. PREW-6R]|uniref:hypothetical protein n=1 Tax=Paraburkholderia sp. PREW-6R TaxID=3141544 RepID=UPI0031F597C4
MNAAQQAVRNAVQRKNPLTPPPPPKFVFLYKLPSPPDVSERFASHLAEVRRYLEPARARHQSSRSDHVLGVTIFVACSIALAWLLATCSAHDGGRPAIVASSSLASPTKAVPAGVHARDQVEAASPRIDTALKAPLEAPERARQSARRRGPQSLSPAASTIPQTPLPTTLEPLVQQIPQSQKLAKASASAAMPRHTAKAKRRITVAGQVTHNARSANLPPAAPTLSGLFERFPPADPSTTLQTTARPSSKADSVAQMALSAWAARQRSPRMSTRARIHVPAESDWNGHMTQRRITDNPKAFQSAPD